MASSLDRWFAPFEGTRNAYPIAIFRIAFFLGVALHFFPSLLTLDDAYRPGALRTEEWNHWLYLHFWKIAPSTIRGLALVTMAATVAGILGFRPRIAAIVSGLGLYAFASFNGLHVHTLALLNTWAIFLLWSICGGGSAVLSVDALFAKPNPAPREPKLLSALVLYQTLLAVFFSGIEKLIAGWPFVNEMGVLLSYPKGFLVRDWVASQAWLHGKGLTYLFTWATVFIEIGAPLLLLRKRTRLAAFVAYQAFFLGIVAMLEVPPIFYCMFAFGALLAFDDEEVSRALARVGVAAKGEGESEPGPEPGPEPEPEPEPEREPQLGAEAKTAREREA
jgi:hypothetical protein